MSQKPMAEEKTGLDFEPLPEVEPEVKVEAKKPVRKPRFLVDEARDKTVQVGYSSVVFRPQQVIDTDHLLDVARNNGILLREV